MSEDKQPKSWKELAQLALDIQNACNLSGCVHTFSSVITDVRANLRAEEKESTEAINTHPVCVLFSDKIASLTMTNLGSENFRNAYKWVKDQVEKT